MSKAKEIAWVQSVLAIITLVMNSDVSARSDPTRQESAPAAWVAPAEAVSKSNPVPRDGPAMELGKKTYIARCLACHGPAGKGDGRTAPRLKVHPGDLSNSKLWQQSDGELFWKISEGKTPMPSYGIGLSEKERWMVVN